MRTYKARKWCSTDLNDKETMRFIVRHCGNAHPHICNYFIKKHGFKDICRLSLDSGSKSKTSHFKDLIIDFIYIIKNLGAIRKAQEIIAIGPMAVNIAFLLKLGLLPLCQRVYWFGLFIHNPRWLRVLRPAFRVLDSMKIQYVVFSEFEKKLYADSLLLGYGRMRYVPYGNLGKGKASAKTGMSIITEPKKQEFFFSGGYSNRDYPSLIEIFRTLKYKLIIVCSALNTEINDDLAIPPNIEVIRDLPSESFNAYVRAAKACIIPIAHNTGAAGQSCLLRYMENKKIIIATDTGIIREYIEDHVSGILVKDNNKSMAKAIIDVGENTKNFQDYGNAAYERYDEIFSGEALEQKLDELLI